MSGVFKVPLILTPQPEGGYTVTSPAIPELLTEGESVEEAVANVHDALEAVLELYEDQGRQIPDSLRLIGGEAAITFEALVPA